MICPISKDLEKIVSAAHNAGKIVLDYFSRQDKEASLKDDNSPLTKADTSASERLCAHLPTIFPLPVLSEEATVDYAIRKNWNSFWLVDPLDGTREFVAGLDEFTINIALIEDNSPKLGVIFAPALQETFVAERGKGAYCFQDNGWKRLPLYSPSQLIAARGRFQESSKFDQFIQTNQIQDVKIIGSALKFCRLAEGQITIYPRYFKSKEWDTAAGQIIITEAGCKIFSLDNQAEPKYNKESLNNDFFIAYSDSIDPRKLELTI